MRVFLSANAGYSLEEPPSMFVGNSKKALGIALIGLFAIYPLGTLFDIICNVIDYNRTISNVIWLLLTTMVCVSTFFAAKDKNSFNNGFGQITAYALIALYATSATNLTIGIFANFSVFFFLGSYAFLVMALITASIVTTYLFLSKVWLPIKILGSITFALRIISGVVVLLFEKIWQIYDSSEINFSAIEQLSLSLVICNCLVAVCSITALILVVIWLNKPDTTPSTRQNPIELI